jgi:hypothetical protein
MADPSAGNFRLNNATVSSATALAISATDSDAGANRTFIAAWDDSTTTAHRGYVILRKLSALGTFAVFDVTGALTDNTTWLQLTLTYVTGSGTFSAADACMVEFYRTGDTGAAGATGATGPTGPTGATGPIGGSSGQPLYNNAGSVASFTGITITTGAVAGIAVGGALTTVASLGYNGTIALSGDARHTSSASAYSRNGQGTPNTADLPLYRNVSDVLILGGGTEGWLGVNVETTSGTIALKVATVQVLGVTSTLITHNKPTNHVNATDPSAPAGGVDVWSSSTSGLADSLLAEDKNSVLVAVTPATTTATTEASYLSFQASGIALTGGGGAQTALTIAASTIAKNVPSNKQCYLSATVSLFDDGEGYASCVMLSIVAAIYFDGATYTIGNTVTVTQLNASGNQTLYTAATIDISSGNVRVRITPSSINLTAFTLINTMGR